MNGSFADWELQSRRMLPRQLSAELFLQLPIAMIAAIQRRNQNRSGRTGASWSGSQRRNRVPGALCAFVLVAQRLTKRIQWGGLRQRPPLLFRGSGRCSDGQNGLQRASILDTRAIDN